jgi:hypothetical protein
VRGPGFFWFTQRVSLRRSCELYLPARSTICRQIKLCITQNWRTPAERYLASNWSFINFPGGVTRQAIQETNFV